MTPGQERYYETIAFLLSEHNHLLRQAQRVEDILNHFQAEGPPDESA